MSLKNSSGQVWQVSGETINWQGWRYVEFPLEASKCGHWGGPDDGKIQFSLKWESFILLDNVSKSKTEGSIHMTAPVVME